MESICAARERLWLATPYFVPDAAIVKALQLAACRGVDIRIVLPKKSDNLLVSLAGLAFLEDLDMPKIQFYRYAKGFMHHKVMLIDKKFASVGTANFDNRSFYLNFEISAVVAGERFAQEVEEMFLNDFKSCGPLRLEDYMRRNPMFRALCQTARLFSPVL
jgi:cardiolipin synthase